jgi:hypothetical protein
VLKIATLAKPENVSESQLYEGFFLHRSFVLKRLGLLNNIQKKHTVFSLSFHHFFYKLIPNRTAHFFY